jgi:hypothetical protein
MSYVYCSSDSHTFGHEDTLLNNPPLPHANNCAWQQNHYEHSIRHKLIHIFYNFKSGSTYSLFL